MSRLSPRLQTVFGPDTLNVGQPAHFTERWTFWFSNHGVRMVNKPRVMMPADEVGQACDVFADNLYDHLTACFDQNSRPVVAVEKNDGTVELRRLQGGTETRFIWTGRQPQLYFNWEVLYYSGESDVVCFYLKTDARTIYARMQRDNFATEYVMNELHCNLATLEEAVTLANRVKLYGKTTGGRTVTLNSFAYPPFPALASDSGYSVMTLTAGSYALTIIGANPAADAAAGTITLFDGAYTLTVKQASATDAGALAVELPSGLYQEQAFSADAGADAGVVAVESVDGLYANAVEHAAADDAGALTMTLAGGSYFVRVIDGGTRSDAAAVAVDIADGSYFIP